MLNTRFDRQESSRSYPGVSEAETSWSERREDKGRRSCLGDVIECRIIVI